MTNKARTVPIFDVTILVLLKEQKSHGYELVARLEDAGVNPSGWSKVYRTLKRMAREGHLMADWDTTTGGRGPARLVYSLTTKGEAWLEGVMADLGSEATFISNLNTRYRAVVQEGGAVRPRSGARAD